MPCIYYIRIHEGKENANASWKIVPAPWICMSLWLMSIFLEGLMLSSQMMQQYYWMLVSTWYPWTAGNMHWRPHACIVQIYINWIAFQWRQAWLKCSLQQPWKKKKLLKINLYGLRSQVNKPTRCKHEIKKEHRRLFLQSKWPKQDLNQILRAPLRCNNCSDFRLLVNI